MGVFSTNAVTDKGRILLAESQVGSLFIPTKIVMGSGSMPSGATPRAMTALVTPVSSWTSTKSAPRRTERSSSEDPSPTGMSPAPSISGSSASTQR